MIPVKSIPNKNLWFKNGYNCKNKKKYNHKWPSARRLLHDSRRIYGFYRNIPSKAGLLLQKCLSSLSLWFFEALKTIKITGSFLAFIQPSNFSKIPLSNRILSTIFWTLTMKLGKPVFHFNNSRFSVSKGYFQALHEPCIIFEYTSTSRWCKHVSLLLQTEFLSTVNSGV